VGRLAIAALTAAVLTSLFFLVFCPQLALPAALVASLYWVGTAAWLKSCPVGAWMLVGILFPIVCCPFVAAILSVIENCTLSSFLALEQVLEPLLDGFVTGALLAPWIALVTFPFGVLLGIILHQITRDVA
jgi:hypothetical protein